MKKENKDIHKQFIKYSNTLLEYNNYIKNEVDRITLSLYDDYLDIDSFSKIDPFMKKNIIYNILNDLYDNKLNIVKEKHVTYILNIIDNKKHNLSRNARADEQSTFQGNIEQITPKGHKRHNE